MIKYCSIFGEVTYEVTAQPNVDRREVIIKYSTGRYNI
jgi:hypothetical protein